MHSKERKPIAKFYSPVATSGIEPHMDKVINLLCEQLDSRFLSEDRSFDLGRWILYCE